jgi:hypothetical protein
MDEKVKLDPETQRYLDWVREYLARSAANEAQQQEYSDVSDYSESTAAGPSNS